MPAPQVTFSHSGDKLSNKSGFDKITVTFSADIAYQAFECRATKNDADYGLGKGALVASFSFTPAETERTFDIYDEYLVNGDGQYRISLYAQGEDGSWNDNHALIPSGQSEALVTADGLEFLCMRG
ncbi:hypothetical protein [Solibaculum mannosilyticum]|uniref:hypothetical protein n=1 Tax=Solibaculum mannosilyticum TaxID=2780922 RepID=UPI0007A831AA|nr:hypothetical protein BN3661_02220 [Eubacteriaceae bacterium CHKCI005]